MNSVIIVLTLFWGVKFLSLDGPKKVFAKVMVFLYEDSSELPLQMGGGSGMKPIFPEFNVGQSALTRSQPINSFNYN